MAPLNKAQIVIDDRLKEKICSFCCLANGSCGLVIGQLDGARFLVTHFVRAAKEPVDKAEEIDAKEWFRCVTRSREDREDESDAGQEDKEDNQLYLSPAWVFTRERVFCQMGDAKDLASARLPSLAVQVSRLLPGGLQILGIYLTSREEVPKAARPRLKEILAEMSVAVQKDCPTLFRDVVVDDKILMAFEPRSCNVITSLTLDAADPKSIIKPISVTFQHLEWVELQTRFRVDLEKPTDLKNRDVEGVLKRMFDSYAGMVRSSVCLINQQFLDNDKPLPPPRDGLLYVGMLSPLESSSSDDGFSQLVEKSQHTASGRLAFRSDVVGRAYLHAKASVGFSLQALKNDLLRSMTTRMELHCEDFLVTDTDEQEFDVVHELPRRILAPLDKTGITFSNYLHENERIRDSLEVFVGLLDMNESLSTADLLINVEKIPNQRDVDSALESVSTHSGDVEVDSVEETVSMGPGLSISNNKAEPIERGHMQTGAVLIAVIFAIAFALYQLYLLKTSSVADMKHSDEL